MERTSEPHPPTPKGYFEMNTFSNCTTQDEAKALYSKLVMEMHPDRHPAEEADKWTRLFQNEFPKLNKDYAEFVAGNVRTAQRERQQAAHDNGKQTNADYNDLDDLYEQWKVIIEACLNLGVDVELIGLWIWVTGPKTYEMREQIKLIKTASGHGFKYAKKKEDRTAWFNDMGVKSFSRGGYSLDDIRGMHGSTRYTKRSNKEEENAAPAAVPATV